MRTSLRHRVSCAPQCVAVGDFNGNGRLDLAVVARFSNVVSVLSQ
ncbi:MAG: hypothetical protein DMG41_29820 [Acidobacteria bacterium]|nr:MAG: hypothetical protein DMG42_09825 [Acidobacteriota bacterium]PYT83816.1 MAG: hypothetical protein DMG41_29820 [Acidobacteriota bacterium]